MWNPEQTIMSGSIEKESYLPYPEKQQRWDTVWLRSRKPRPSQGMFLRN